MEIWGFCINYDCLFLVEKIFKDIILMYNNFIKMKICKEQKKYNYNVVDCLNFIKKLCDKIN